MPSHPLQSIICENRICVLFSDLGLTDVREEPGVGSAAMGVVLPGFVQAEGAVHGQADIGGVLVLLAIVLPPADRAQPQCAGRLQRLVPAARAAKTNLYQSPHECMDENGGARVYLAAENRNKEWGSKLGGDCRAAPIAVPLRDVIKRLAMKPESALIFVLVIACALPCSARHPEQVQNNTAEPLPVVDITDEAYNTVAQLYVMPGETMLLDSTEKPAAGAGYYQAMPGEDYLLLISSKFQLPRLGKEYCPCVLHMDTIGWNRQGTVTTITGLRPYLETSSGTKIAIVSDVKHVRIANGKVYFKLQDHGSSEYWVLTRFGQVVGVGGPWGFWEMARFLLFSVLPLVLLGLFAFSVVGAIRLLREDSHPEKSFIELMRFSLMRLPLLRKLSGKRELEK